MMLLWIIISVTYYVIGFYLKYLEGSIYVNALVLGFAASISVSSGAIMMAKFGLKESLTISLSIALTGGMLLMLFANSLKSFVPFFVLLSMFGCGSGFGLVYEANFIFPVEYATQTLGFCNLMARLFTILAPLISE